MTPEQIAERAAELIQLATPAPREPQVYHLFAKDRTTPYYMPSTFCGAPWGICKWVEVWVYIEDAVRSVIFLDREHFKLPICPKCKAIMDHINAQ